MNPIIIVNVHSLSDDNHEKCWEIASRLPNKMRSVYSANIVIIRTKTHFRCIKNRWDWNAEDEKIPNFLLKDYLIRYKEYFTKEQLMAAIAKDYDSEDAIYTNTPLKWW